jgi:hypothetical protein
LFPTRQTIPYKVIICIIINCGYLLQTVSGIADWYIWSCFSIPFRKILNFYGEGILAPRPTSNLDGHSFASLAKYLLLFSLPIPFPPSKYCNKVLEDRFARV